MPEPVSRSGDRIVIAGSSGLIGRALTAALRARGDQVTRLVRPGARPDTGEMAVWNPGSEPLDPEVLRDAKAVICLNGVSISRAPWTTRHVYAMVRSRLVSARTIGRAVQALGAGAPHYICSSGISWYGDTHGVQADEQTLPGSSILARLCVAWERAATLDGELQAATTARQSSVLDPDAVLAPFIALTKLGLGGPLGPGTNSLPWISLPDTVASYLHLIDRQITGPVNIVGPLRASLNDVGFAVAMALKRPYLLHTPAWLIRMIMREAAQELILSDIDAAPKVLERTGFNWQHRTAEAAIADALAA